ncbi:MAG: hypothetical protein EG825_00370 [Rhodocyclaceae bacterium]|nr:hypothetical protein [Rhodocyclaceae bacterium]
MLIKSGGVPDNLDEVIRQLPVQPSQEMVLLMAERFQRDQSAMGQWATDAKRCVDFFEGKQWDEEALRKMELEGRPALTFNKIGPLVRLILGYHRNNRTDLKYLPAFDGTGSQVVSEALTKIVKQISEESDKEYIDTEVFLDGLVTGRGYYDYRLDFENNDYGEIAVRAKDPFSIYPDCEADQYDLNGGNRITEARWVNLDEIEFTYGKAAAMMIWGFVHRGGYGGGIPFSLAEMMEEVTPWRTFGGANENDATFGIHSYIANCYDLARKNIRLIDSQHYVRAMTRVFLDLETGRREKIPDSWDGNKINKVLAWMEERCLSKGQQNPFRVVTRPMRRVRWTTMVGDIVVHDGWGPYETFSIVPFFPYFRRGKTRGMVDDLIDPQLEINKRRSAQIDIITRTAHSGWMYHENGLSEEEKQNIEENGAMPGVNIKWRGDPAMKPERISPATPPMAMERLEEKATSDLKEIAGINDSALGQLDRVQSGRAIEARQRQSVLSVQTYMDNMSRTQKMCGRKSLEMIQNHFIEERTFHILSDEAKITPITINLRQATGDIMNDVTVGNYTVNIDETPLSASFMSAQMDEMLSLVEKGLLPAAAIMDVAIDISSLPKKEVLKQRVQSFMNAQGMMTGDQIEAAASTPTPAQPAQAGTGMEAGVPLPQATNDIQGAPLNG